KPVVLWKVGLTPEGGKAAASHTGALSGSREIWNGVIQQAGAIPVKGFDVLLDTLMGFCLLPPELGDRVAVLSGPGGLAVAAAEACGDAGLKLAEISPKTLSTLAEFIPPTGTSLRNPIDVGLTASLDIQIYIRAAKALAADPGVDAILVVGRGMTPDSHRLYTEGMIQAQKQSGKPFSVVNIPGFDVNFAKDLYQAGIPFFETVERAVTIYAQVRRYQIWRSRIAETNLSA
ncbi:MAG: acetate--CoA ligase family protein, partial [Deltaproteobacteria bacterium]|nr:acetate--CoA ligase family protein [Deltaproteobacteria bacterium]